MRIVVDAFGGDNAPVEILKGCEMAVREYGIDILLCGDEEKIKACAAENGISLDRMDIAHAPGIITMEDHAEAVIKSKKDSSMSEGLRRVAAGDGDAFVSAGSTSALVMGATFLTKRIKGIKRAALAPIIPTDTGCTMIIDTGANVECRPEMLAQFGLMGSEYMRDFCNIDRPRVGLLNVGTEDTKGGSLQKESFAILKEMPINFIGNVEARDIMDGVCDVLVCDGFSGNIVLKLAEGVVGTIMGNLKSIMLKNTRTKLAAAVLKPGLRELKHRMDYTEIGGAVLMGIAKPVIKSHGNSKAKAFKNAINQAVKFAESGAIDRIAANVSKESKSDNDQA